MRRWKFAQKLFLSSERFCGNNLEYISISLSYDLCGSVRLNMLKQMVGQSVLFYPLISYRYQARKQGRATGAGRGLNSGSTFASSVVKILRFPPHFIRHLQQYN